MSYDKTQGVINDSQPYQQIGNNTVASTTLGIWSHDIFLHQVRIRLVIGSTAEKVLDGVFHYTEPFIFWRRPGRDWSLNQRWLWEGRLSTCVPNTSSGALVEYPRVSLSVKPSLLRDLWPEFLDGKILLMSCRVLIMEQFLGPTRWIPANSKRKSVIMNILCAGLDGRIKSHTCHQKQIAPTVLLPTGW